MNKTIRIVLYVLSILTVAGVIAAAILTGGQAKPASAPGATAEEELTQKPLWMGKPQRMEVEYRRMVQKRQVKTEAYQRMQPQQVKMEAYQMIQPQQLELGVHQMKQQTRIIKKTPAIQPSS